MKECRKCKKQFKDEYSFCPNCGKPYDANLSNASVPSESKTAWGIICTITNVILYIVAGILLIGLLVSIAEQPLFSIPGILFCLSLFKCFYKIVENKFNILNSKKLLITRFVIPFVMLIIWIVLTGIEGDTTKEITTQVQTQEESVEIDVSNEE